MEDLFKDKAPDWDAHPIPKAISAGVGAALLRAVQWSPNMEILDFGAGTGLIAAHVAPMVKRLWAVDVSASMLEKLKAKAELADRVETVRQDIMTKPLTRTFDGIVSAMAMHHVQDSKQLFERFYEHVAPGGFVALADLDQEDGSFHPADIEGVYHKGFEREALAELMTQAGFVNPVFETAVTLEKEGREYPVFLVTARKPA